MPRTVLRLYQDPLELVWLRAAGELGWRIVRNRSAYASWDGAGTLTLAPPEDLDADDTLAQMILHEICHALVAGPRAAKARDWGLDNTTSRDLVQEHATNRLQAALAEPYGLRDFLAVTTDFRGYYDALSEDPLKDGDDPAIGLAQAAMRRARTEPYASILERALEATARLASVIHELTDDDSLWRTVRARHPSGLLLPQMSVSNERCGSCAWSFDAEGQLLCRQAAGEGDGGKPVQRDDLACERWEACFDEQECSHCGACCHRGFDLVELGAADVFVTRHAELVQQTTLGPILPRPGGRCAALDGSGTRGEPYRCRFYDERPESCRDFEVRGAACLLARRRVGLSR